jgi:hypothetical protein
MGGMAAYPIGHVFLALDRPRENVVEAFAHKYHGRLARDDNGGLAGYTQATGQDGTIYAAWSDGSSIVFTSSNDGGLRFAASHPVVSTGPPYFGEVPYVARVSGFPVLGMDVRKGHRGRLYLCWSDYTNGDVDVFIASSSDHGSTWSKPFRVNDDPVHNGKDQFFQWMAVDPVSGNVFVDFYDRRGRGELRNSSDDCALDGRRAQLSELRVNEVTVHAVQCIPG